MKYKKNQSKCAKFEYVVPGTVVGLPKKLVAKIKFFFLPSDNPWHSANLIICRVPNAWHSAKFFK